MKKGISSIHQLAMSHSSASYFHFNTSSICLFAIQATKDFSIFSLTIECVSMSPSFVLGTCSDVAVGTQDSGRLHVDINAIQYWSSFIIVCIELEFLKTCTVFRALSCISMDGGLRSCSRFGCCINKNLYYNFPVVQYHKAYTTCGF